MVSVKSFASGYFLGSFSYIPSTSVAIISKSALIASAIKADTVVVDCPGWNPPVIIIFLYDV